MRMHPVNPMFEQAMRDLAARDAAALAERQRACPHTGPRTLDDDGTVTCMRCELELERRPIGVVFPCGATRHPGRAEGPRHRRTCPHPGCQAERAALREGAAA